MINLLPPKSEQSLKRLYRYRAATVLCLFCTGVALLGIVLLVPSFVLLRSQVKAYEATSQAVKKEQENVSVLAEQIRAANTLSQEVARYQEPMPFSEVIADLYNVAGSAVNVDAIAYEEKAGVAPQLLVSGTAKNRASLTAFSSAIIAHERFATANIPIQNLAGDRDVAFTITVTLAPAE